MSKASSKNKSVENTKQESLFEEVQLLRQENEQLRHSEKRLRTYISQSTEAIWMVEYKPPIPTSLPLEEQARLMLQRELLIEWNQAASEIYGFGNPDDSLGLPTATIRGEENNAVALANAIEFIENGYKFVGKESIQESRSGKTITFLINAAGIVEDGFLTATWGNERDISTIREAEQFLRKHMQELERSNRELQQFTFVATHDLQEPLRKIQMLASVLATRYANLLEGKGIDYLHRLQDTSARMRTLIEEMLTYSRMSTEIRPFTSVNLNDVIQDVLFHLESPIRKEQATIQLNHLPNVYGDRTQLSQLFQQLVSNAIKFHEPGVAPVVTITSEQLENEYVIKVVDNGIGFDEKYNERIFVMFQRLHSKKQYEGTGVGLALCRKVVEQHGGKIHAHGQLGEGATFIVTLPFNNAYD